jgi:arylsulfatase A-like enzyme
MRGSLLTGLYAWNHRAITNDLPIKSDCESIAHVLSNKNYHTGYIGKWHLGGVPRQKPILKENRLGFDEWKVANCNHNYEAGKAWYYDEENELHITKNFESIEQTDMAVDFIKRRSLESKPWFLTLSWGPPHAPYNAVPQEYFDMYNVDEISLPENTAEFDSYMLQTNKFI